LTKGRVIVSRDEDYRRYGTALSQPPVQLKTRHAGKKNVQDQAISRLRDVGFKGRFRTTEHSDLEAPGT
jgi:hypothetical protein